MELTRVLFSPSSKNEKNPPRKKFLIFHEMELSSSNIKKFLYFLTFAFPEMKPGIFQSKLKKLKKKKKKKKKQTPQGNSLYSWIIELSNCNIKNNILGN